MLTLEPVICARLREALTAPWTVMGFTADAGRRDGDGIASVLFADANVADPKTSAALVQSGWRVTLVRRRSAAAAVEVDAAFTAVVKALHNWRPGEVAGRRWEPVRLQQVMPPQYAEEGLVGLELTFTTAARYDGQD